MSSLAVQTTFNCELDIHNRQNLLLIFSLFTCSIKYWTLTVFRSPLPHSAMQIFKLLIWVGICACTGIILNIAIKELSFKGIIIQQTVVVPKIYKEWFCSDCWFDERVLSSASPHRIRIRANHNPRLQEAAAGRMEARRDALRTRSCRKDDDWCSVSNQGWVLIDGF